MTGSRPDMNLIAVLHVLLEERNVTRAAHRIGVSQPAASVMLGRLRRHYGDDLLKRVGNQYELTPLGLILSKQTGSILELSDRLFATKSRFDPATTDREFVVALSDYSLGTLGPALLDTIEEQAPHAQLRFRPIGRTIADDSSAAVRLVDGLILPHSAAPARLPHLELYRDEWVCLVASADADRATAELTELDWVLGYHDPATGGDLDRRLRGTGLRLDPLAADSIERRLERTGIRLKPLAIDSFDLLPRFVRAHRRLALIQRRLAETIARPDTTRIIDCPVDLGPIIETYWWHPVHTDDAGHTWFRHLVRDTARAVAH
ncbi:LysR family transcriptional regulator [Nocardia asteroides]|uniref:LysR family transcriptional regulator n=1 Tax=Nocardia asteroides TaxID=1824 RepID=UPI003443BCF1